MSEFKTKKEHAFYLLEKGYGKKRIMDELKCTVASYHNYRSLWKKENKTPITPKIKKSEVEEVIKIKDKNKFVVVDIVLEDGTFLENCGVWGNIWCNHEPKNSDLPLQKVEEIENAFQKVPWGHKNIYFQNKFINGYIHVNNIKAFEIKTVEV